MPNAVITTQNFIVNGTQIDYLNNIAASMVIAGFTEIDSYADGANSFKVFSFDADATKTYGKMILRVGFTTNTNMTITGFSSWNAAANTGTDPSTVNKAVALTDSVTAQTCNHPEVRGVMLTRTSAPFCFIGYFRPPAPNNGWWDQNQSSLGFIERGNTSSWQSSAMQTISNLRPSAISASLGVATMSNNNSGNSSNSNYRMSGGVAMSVISSFNFLSFSSDLIGSATVGMDTLSKIQIVPGAEEYAIFDGGSSSVGNRIAVRVI